MDGFDEKGHAFTALCIAAAAVLILVTWASDGPLAFMTFPAGYCLALGILMQVRKRRLP